MRDLFLPRQRPQADWKAGLASLVVHILVLAMPGAYIYQRARQLPEVQLLRLETRLQVVDMNYQPRERVPVRPPPQVDVERVVAPDALAPPVAEPRAAPSGFPPPRVDTGGGAPRPGAEGPEVLGGLRPALGDGRLWVEPLPLAPGELARRLTRSHYELLDSAVTAIVQAYLDSVIAAPTPYGNAPPSWTTQIGGKTFGIDNRFIHLGGLRIPTALLALLPLPAGTNVDLRSAQQAAAMRQDLIMASQRSQTMEDFKKAVREIREEQERKRELERNQRQAPTDTIPPAR